MLREWYCHTWGRAWLEAGKDRRIVWVTPKEQDPEDYKDSRRGLGRELRVVPRDKFDVAAFAQRHTLDSVHICRSGCWVPTWLDDRFVSFVNRFVNVTPSRHKKRPLHVLQDDPKWHPMKRRWENPEKFIAQLRELDANMQAMRNKKIEESNATACTEGHQEPG